MKGYKARVIGIQCIQHIMEVFMNTKKSLILKVLVLSIATSTLSPDCSAAPEWLKNLGAKLGFITATTVPAIIFPDQIANGATALSDRIGQYLDPTVLNAAEEIAHQKAQIEWAQRGENGATFDVLPRFKKETNFSLSTYPA